MTEPRPRFRLGLLNGLRNNLLAGIIVIAPLGLTVWLIWSVIGWFDSWVLPFVPNIWLPEHWVNLVLGNVDATGRVNPADPDYVNVNIHGVGIVIFILFTILVGWIAKGLIGRSFIGWGESVVDRMPIVRSVYNGVKQIAETVFAQTETSFDKACLIEFPRKDVWSLAFVATSAKGELRRKIVDFDGGPPAEEDDILTVLMPTTPNPTTGFLLYARRSELIILDMTVEDAAKLIISAGLVYPAGKEPPEALAGAVPPPAQRPG